MSEPRIRWEDTAYGGFTGHTGTMDGWAFQVWANVGRWTLQSGLTGQNGRHQRGDEPDQLKAEAERWLEEFVSSLGVSFAVTDAARSFAKTWQELLTSGLADGYGCTLNCPEADAAADLYRAQGDEKTAAEIIRTHAAHDDEGDAHHAGGGDG